MGSGYKQLACAVIQQAIDDYREVSRPYPSAVVVEGAKFFLLGKTPGPVKGTSALDFWCDCAGIDRRSVQDKVFIANRRKHTAKVRAINT